ncbi:MAG: 3-isopropylmalate dehydrogenase [Dehalococcoidia bacterium]|nr:3-isopropylmalate dehydrogenase [Dehalococcoidia bacterium]
MDLKIAVIGGDGIGPEVTAESVKVLDAVGRRYGHEFEWRTGQMGGCAIDKFGTPLPDETMDTILGCDAILFGAVGGPKWDDPRAKTRPEDGILRIRKELGLFANIRPIKVYQELVHSSPLREERLKDVDMVILRELTGGLYFGRPKKRWENARGRRAVDTLSYTEKEIERVVRVGFEMARNRRGKLTSVDKANVLESGRLWREVTTELHQEYRDVELDHLLVDNAAMQLITNPSRFDVIVTENTFGDILSDEASVLSGSMGMLPSASITSPPPKKGARRRRGGKPALYEPIHGSAPDISGHGVANPVASLLSSAIMLRWSFGLHEEADAIEKGVTAIMSEGFRTPDIAIEGDKCIGTVQFGDMVASAVGG